ASKSLCDAPRLAKTGGERFRLFGVVKIVDRDLCPSFREKMRYRRPQAAGCTCHQCHAVAQIHAEIAEKTVRKTRLEMVAAGAEIDNVLGADNLVWLIRRNSPIKSPSRSPDARI